MTDPNYTAIMLLVDRSGSMAAIRTSAEAGINEFITSQANATAGRRTIRIAQFDHEYETVRDSRPPAHLEPFQLHPRGNTALLDAMGRAIVEFGAELDALPEDIRPGTVILAVMTDGHENSSLEYTWPQIKSMVERQERDFAWQVLYLGANQDAIAVGERLGVRADRAMTYASTGRGTRSMTHSVRSYVDAAASGASAAFTDQQRDDATR